MWLKMSLVFGIKTTLLEMFSFVILFLFISALLGTVLCFLIMFMISYKYAALAVGR